MMKERLLLAYCKLPVGLLKLNLFMIENKFMLNRKRKVKIF